MLIDGIAGLDARTPRVIVAGSGPVGLALATDLARRGHSVLMLESGGRSANPHVQQLSAADLQEPARHDDMSVAVARRLGGSSNLWGGRCVPYDPLDFEPRPHVAARWPIGYDEVSRYHERAVRATHSGAAIFTADELLAGEGDAFSPDGLERWVNTQGAHVVHRQAIAADRALEVRTHATLAAMIFDEGGRVVAAEIAHSLTGARVTIGVERLVIAAGGLETARLLLAAQRTAPGRFGAPDGPLGRYYMGHVIGEIADVVFPSAEVAAKFDFYIDRHGSYVRRRISPSRRTQGEHDLLNSAFWPVVAPVADPRHGSAILSMVYLAMSYGPLGRLLTAEAIRRRHVPDKPAGRLRHIANVVTGAPSALAFSAQFLKRRYAQAERLPGFFMPNKANRYGLSYHSEHAPDAASRVWLTGQTDRLGLPSLAIDLRFGEQDVDSLVRTHDLLGAWLADKGLGRIEYRVPPADRGAAILAQAAHGTHQVGLTRMGAHRREAVVDRNLACFDAPNLYLASSSVLPTSSQANPTFTAVALALRLADHLADEISRPAACATSEASVVSG